MTPTRRPGRGRHFLLGLIAMGLACGTTPKPAADAAPPETPASSPTPETSASESEAAPSPAVTKFGVPECDAYVQKYLNCIEGKITGEEKEKMLEAFELNRTKWRAMSTMKESALALGIACRAATQKAKEELSVEYGCEF